MPWSWSTEPPPNHEGLEAIAAVYETASGYATWRPSRDLTGTRIDWVYGRLGVPAFTIELTGNTFLTECADLNPILDESLPALHAALALSDRPYLRSRGPKITEARDGLSVAQGDELSLEVLVEAGTVIAGAELTIGRLGGVPSDWPMPHPDLEDALGLAMLAVDGAFDSGSENAMLRLDTNELLVGRHYLVFRAVDTEGSWGPAHAVWLHVEGPGASVTPGILTPPPTPMTATPSATDPPATDLPAPCVRCVYLPALTKTRATHQRVSARRSPS